MCRLVTTPLYQQLVEMVVEEEESVGVKVVEQLAQGGHKPQAQSLQVRHLSWFLSLEKRDIFFQMLFEGVPAGLRTMASVVQRLRRGNNNK